MTIFYSSLLYCYTAMYVYPYQSEKTKVRFSDIAGVLSKLFRLGCISRNSFNRGETRSRAEPAILSFLGSGRSCQHARLIDHISTDKDLGR